MKAGGRRVQFRRSCPVWRKTVSTTVLGMISSRTRTRSSVGSFDRAARPSANLLSLLIGASCWDGAQQPHLGRRLPTCLFSYVAPFIVRTSYVALSGIEFSREAERGLAPLRVAAKLCFPEILPHRFIAARQKARAGTHSTLSSEGRIPAP